MNIVIELEFPWGEDGTRQDELDFAELVLKLVTESKLGPLSPKGGVIANVRTVRGSMAVARAATSGYHHDANDPCTCPMSKREEMQNNDHDGPGPWHSRGCAQWRPLAPITDDEVERAGEDG
jgi:hypothetical protein